MALSSEACERLLSGRRRQTAVALNQNAYAEYRRRLQGPRLQYDEDRSSWVAARYGDVRQIVLDPHTFSSQRTLNPDGSIDEVASGSILGLDPPRHRQLRQLLAQAFTQARVAQLEPRIRQITDRLLDATVGCSTIDVIDALAFPLPVMIIAELLGVPLADIGQFRDWAADLLSNDLSMRAQTFARFAEYFDSLVEERNRAPTTDLISALMQAKLADARLERRDVTSACTLLLIAGHETTTSLIANLLWCLDDYPEAREDLTGHPELLPGAIEETLRLRAVVHYMPRVVTRDITFLGQELRQGELVLPLLAAANLDPAEFPEPERFDIRRSPNRHFGFGFGIHLCLGASLARLEATIAVGRLLERYPKLARDRSRALDLRPSPFLYALKRLQIALQ